nr:MAG TPA: hypothetical protein [Caudoviricetes sp.]
MYNMMFQKCIMREIFSPPKNSFISFHLLIICVFRYCFNLQFLTFTLTICRMKIIYFFSV